MTVRPDETALLRRSYQLLQAGDAAGAEAALGPLLQGGPGAGALHLRGLIRRRQGRLAEAEADLRGALALEPANPEMHNNLGLLMASMDRRADALAAFDEALRLRPSLAAAATNRGRELMRQGRALAGEGRLEDAIDAFRRAVQAQPDNPSAQSALAHALWMHGAGDGFCDAFERAVAAHPASLPLRLACADLLRRADMQPRAEALLREGMARGDRSPVLVGALGVVLDEMGRVDEAVACLSACVAAEPSREDMRLNLAHALLRAGRPDEAMRHIAPLRAARPLDGQALAFEADALRQMGDARYGWLCDVDRMVQPFDLSPPPGWSTMAAFNADLATSLNRLHGLAAHPLDQSLRGGSQTHASLLEQDDPVIRAFLAALDEPIRAYIDAMPDEPGHPLYGRRTHGYRLAGSWSVRLEANGYHVNHLHPEGWISSAYYVDLPDCMAGSNLQEGWIKFGEPRQPLPGCGVRRAIEPRAGRLVLFPSYFWHGTIPFSSGVRLTAPFDVVPA